MPDDEDRPRDASSAAGDGWSDPAHGDPAVDDTEWADTRAPDDISELTAEIAAYRRELRHARWRVLLRRLMRRPGITSLSLIAAGLAVAALVATLITALEPDAKHHAPAALPLAHPTAPVGQPHGLLPDVSLQSMNGPSVASRSLRPAVLALIPLNCQCVPLLNTLASEAYTQALPLVVVAPTVADAEAAALVGQLDRGVPRVLYDSSGTLAADFETEGVTILALDRDGTVFDVERNVPASGSATLTGRLRSMVAAR